MSLTGPSHDDDTTAEVLTWVNEAHNADYELVTKFDGGANSGAYLLAGPGGSPAVLKWTPDLTWARQILRAAPGVSKVRERGYPTPAWLAVGTTRRGFPYQVQDFVEGDPLCALDEPTADLILEVVDRQAGMNPDPGRNLSEIAAAEVASGPRRARVRNSGETGRHVVETFDRLCRAVTDRSLPSGDMVHGDLGLENVLARNGHVTGVIDIEALGNGSRVFDLAKVILHGYVWESQPSALRRVHQHAEAIAGSGALRILVAANTYNLLDHGLTHWPSIDPVLPAILQLAADL